MAKKAPIYTAIPHPKNFKSTYEEEKYWANKQKLYIEGEGSIPGSFAYFMENCVVKDRTSGTVILPEAREVDLLMHETIALQRKNKRHLGIIKARNVGLSTQFGVLCNYYVQTYPGSNCLVTSRSQKGTKLIFEDKILPIYDNLHPSIKPTTLNMNKTNQSSYLKLGTRVKSKVRVGEIEVAESNIICSETSENPKSPQNFSGYGAIGGFYDEYPLHPRKKELLDSSIECYKNAKTRKNEGMILFGGTVEASEELSGDKLLTFKTFIDELDDWQCDLLFLPYWWTFETHLNNGYPNKKKAEEEWNKQYDILSKSKDPSKLTAFIRNNPPDLESIWDTAGGDRWEETTLEIIKEQRKVIINNPPPRAVGNFLDLNQGAEFRASSTGSIVKLEDPKPNIEYYTVVDSASTGSETGSANGSDVAAFVIKGYDPAGFSYAPVCMYSARPKTIESAYTAICSMSKYYEKIGDFKGIMAESNAATAEHFSVYLKRVNLQRYIMYGRDFSGKKVSSNSNTRKPFVYVTDDIRRYQMKEANVFLRKYYESIRYIELLDEMLEPISANTDKLDAFLMLFLALPPDYDKPPKSKIIKPRQVRRMERDSTGALVYKWVDV